MQKRCVVRRKCQSHEYNTGGQIVYTRQSDFNFSLTICQHIVRMDANDEWCIDEVSAIFNIYENQYKKTEKALHYTLIEVSKSGNV